MKKYALVLALTLTALPPTTFSQELDEIVVTAQRREQNLQEVPVSVTAFGGAELERSNIKSATEYLALTPNVSFTEDGQAGSRGLGIAVRGVNNLISGENAAVNSVGIYLDEFSVASIPSQVANPFLPDMERLEVLRGPQGTYFGRNAVGGALNLTTKKPTDENGGKIIIGGETYDDAGEMFSFTGIGNVAVNDNFRLRGVLYYEDSSGLVENICAAGATASCPLAAANGFTPNGAADSGHDYIVARVKGEFDFSEDTTLGFTLMYADEDQGHDENVPSGILDVDSVDTFGIQQAEDPGTGFWPNNRNLVSHDLPENNQLESLVGIVNITHNIDDQTVIKSITGFIDAEQSRLFDNDLVGGLDAVSRTNLYEGFSWSSELRLEHTSEVLDAAAGLLFYRDEQLQSNNVAVSTQPTATINGVGILPPFPEGLGLALNSKAFEAEGFAMFADFTWHTTDRLDLIAGGRVTLDNVTNRLQGNGIGPGPTSCPPPVDIVCFFQGFVTTPRPPSNAEEDFEDFAPRVGFRFQATEDVGIYGTISKGYKAGGTSVGNNTNAAGQPAFTVFYDKEELWNYELGIKAELLDRRVRINAAIFQLDWENLQYESFRFLTSGDISSNFEQTVNIEDAEASGFELEFLAAATDNFTIGGGIGLLDTEIQSATPVQITGGYVVNLLGLDLPKAPELTANLYGEYRFPLGDNEAWVRLELIHRDGQYSDIEGLTNLQTRGPSPNQGLSRPVGPNEFPFLSPDYDVVNLRAGYEADTWSLSVFVQNLGDEEYYTGTQENFGVSGIRLRPHPRVIGASVSFNFGEI